jgi:epidermal growth factor receptor substrate 15
LPFGKKKKQQQAAEAMPPMPPPAFLTPPREEGGGGTPAESDDADGVKQLTAMGFSRGQAIGALEKHGYDVPRALNSLLGQS